MNIEKLVYKLHPPCPKCPYKLGQVHTLTDPCPQCKRNGYKTYERFINAIPDAKECDTRNY